MASFRLLRARGCPPCIWLPLLVAVGPGGPLDSADGDLAVVGATIHVGDGLVFPDGVLVASGGKIRAVGPRDAVAIPDDARVVDAAGRHLTPGFIDLDSLLFLEPSDRRVAGGSSPASIVDAMAPLEKDGKAALARGVTTVAVHGDVLPGAGSLGAVVKLRDARAVGTGDDSVVGSVAGSHPAISPLARESHIVLAIANSGAPRSTSAERLEGYHRLRALFRSAADYGKSWEQYWKAVESYNAALRKAKDGKGDARAPETDGAPPGGETPRKETRSPPPPKLSPPDPAGDPTEEPPPVPEEGEEGSGKVEAEKPAAPPNPASPTPKAPARPAVDVGKEALLRALRGELPVLVRAERRDEIRHALRLKEELGLRLAILGGTEAYRVASMLAEEGCPVVVAPALLLERRLEHRGHREENAARLVGAGVQVAVASAGAGGFSTARLPLEAAIAVRGGLSREKALEALTLVPARILGIDDRLGSLEPGKDADFVIFGGEPLDALSPVEAVAVEGVLLSGGAPAGPAGPEAERERRRHVRGGSRLERASLASASLEGPGAPARATASAEALPGAEGPVGDGEGRRLVLRNARVAVPEGDGIRWLDGATVVVVGSRIREILPAAPAPSPPDGAEIVDLEGKWVTPGFLDLVSDVGVRGETEEPTLSVSEGIRMLEAWDPWDDEIAFFLRRGITSAAIAPGAGNVVGGEVAVVKLVPGRSPPRVVRARAAVRASLDPNLSLSRFPTSLAGALRTLEDWTRERGPELASSGVPVLCEVPTRTAAERALEILGARGIACALIEGRGLDPVSWAETDVPGPVILRARGLEDRGPELALAGILSRRGAPVAFCGGGSLWDPPLTLLLSVRAGMGREDALAAVTSAPARILGLGEALGSIRAGSDADLVVWSGDPLTLLERAEAVIVDGEWLLKDGEILSGRGRGEPDTGGER